jgi:hypothetical protein
MSNITISQALKLKNKKINSINKLAEIIQSWNSVERDTERPYNVCETLEKYVAEQDELVKLKTAIHKASDPVRNLIFRQSELKTRINFLRSIDTTNGTKRGLYNSSEYVSVAEIKINEINEMIDALELEIENIQMQLDDFNHKNLVTL